MAFIGGNTPFKVSRQSAEDVGELNLFEGILKPGKGLRSVVDLKYP